MKLKAVLDSLDGVDEKYHELYSEVGGKHVLQIDGIKAHPTVENLASALGRQKTEIKDLKRRASNWDELVELRGEDSDDLSPDDIHSALEAKSSGSDDKDVQAKIEEAERRGAERAEKKANREIEKISGERDQYRSGLQKRVGTDLDLALAEAGVKESLRPAARALLLQNAHEMVEEDGEFQGVFKSDADGIPRDTPFAEFVSSWVQTDAAAAFMPAGGGGSGAGDSGGSGGGSGKSIDRNDPMAWGQHAEAIARGEMSAR